MPGIVPRDWKLPDALVRRLGDTHGRQRAMAAEGHLLLILHAAPLAGAAERTGRMFWRDQDGFWRGDDGRHGAGEVRKVIDAYQVAVDAIEERINTADAADDYFSALRHVRPLHRAVRHLHAALQQAREAVEDPALISLRDAAGAVERGAELAAADAQAGLEFTIANRVEAHAAAQHRLNVLAAIFFPITAIATIMGMNLTSGLEGGPAWWFWAATGIAFAAGFVVRALVVGRRPG